MTPLALSLGDPAGIGPELIAAAWANRQEHHLPPFFLCGGARVVARAAEARGLDCPLVTVASPQEAVERFHEGLPVLGEDDGAYRPGEPDTEGARLAHASLGQAVALACSGQASGLVTGPVSKARLAEVGFAFPGQTEFVADACGKPVSDAVMMLAGPSLRTVPVTVHCSLAAVSEQLTTETIVHKGMVTAAALRRDFGIASPRLAVAGLNPHAGEEGRFGDEEARIITPAIGALRDSGIDASGPHPADALFAPRARETYDAALCMYHDQALIPLKALDFDSGVNCTLGLPVVRTSPDHGTAFAIAGKRLADPGATIAAIRMAGEHAARRAAA